LRRGRAKIGSANRSLFRQRTKKVKDVNTGKTGKIQKFQNVSFSGPTSSSPEVSYKRMDIGKTGQKRQTPLISLLYYSSILLPLCRVISPQSSSFLIHDPIIVKYPLWKLEGIPDKFIQSNLVTNSYSRNNLETKKNEEKNIFGDSFEFTLKENGMKYIVRNDMKSELYGMKRVTMESDSNGKSKKRESIRQLPLTRKDAISDVGNLKYGVLTMGKVKRLPLRRNTHKRSGKKTSSKPVSCIGNHMKEVTQREIEKLMEHVKTCKHRRSQSKETRLYLRNTAMNYSDPVVIGMAKTEHYKLARWELLAQEVLNRHFAYLELQFRLYIAKKNKGE